MGQVMSRMQLTWLGTAGPLNRTRQTFFVVLLLVVAFFVYSTALEIASIPYEVGDAPTFIESLKLAGNLLFSLWAMYALCRTRETVRARYQIPEERCKGCEDLCCSVFCGCCAVAQMMRHTGEYENYPAVCCSATGHPPGTPLVV
jgi:Cys-rich protein (TIGR01571 family)